MLILVPPLCYDAKQAQAPLIASVPVYISPKSHSRSLIEHSSSFHAAGPEAHPTRLCTNIPVPSISERGRLSPDPVARRYSMKFSCISNYPSQMFELCLIFNSYSVSNQTLSNCGEKRFSFEFKLTCYDGLLVDTK